MSRIFLGRPWHWAIVLIIIGLGWFAGSARLHVTHFNSFLIVLALGTIFVLALIIGMSTPGQQVTRDPIEDMPSDE